MARMAHAKLSPPTIAQPVRWRDSTKVLVAMEVCLFVEMNRGQVLTSLAGEPFPEARAIAAENIKYLLKLICESQERR
jgi:malonyl CoA-acyl carrier protein transacylase